MKTIQEMYEENDLTAWEYFRVNYNLYLLRMGVTK